MPIGTIAKKLISITRKLAPAPTLSAEPVRLQPLPVGPQSRSDRDDLAASIASGRLVEASAIYYRTLQALGAEPQELTEFYTKVLFENGHLEACEAFCMQQGYKILKLASAEDWARHKRYPILDAGEIEAIPIARPQVFGASGYVPAESPPKIVLSAKPYVAELRDVTISSKSSVIVTPDGYALNDVAAHPAYGDYVSLQYDKTIISKAGGYVLTKAPYPVTRIENGIFLSGLASEYFGHWIPEFLKKLRFYVQHPDFESLPLIVDANMPQSHFDYLSALVDNPVLRLPELAAFHCEKLLVAPTATFYPVELLSDHPIPQHEIGPLSPAGLTWMQERILSNPSFASSAISYGRKLYLSRRNMLWRKADNDAQIAEVLAHQGFDVVDVEKLSFREQVQMFRNAECIVAPNGSSMLNLIFAPRDVKLFVLSQPDVFNWGGYYGPIHALGYEMIFITGDDAPAVKHANYHVPIERIEDALSRYA